MKNNIKDFEYFFSDNAENIYIEERNGVQLKRFAVWQNGSCVDDCLVKGDALRLANEILKEVYV
jgi:hypothetical protein